MNTLAAWARVQPIEQLADALLQFLQGDVYRRPHVAGVVLATEVLKADFLKSCRFSDANYGLVDN